MDTKTKQERLMHRAAALTGGFTGMYTVMILGNLGSSQTVCWLDMLKGLLGNDLREFMLRLPGIVIYGASVFTATYLNKRGKVDTRLISAGLCAVGFLIMGAMPEDIDRCIALYIPFITMSFLWVVFGGLGGYASAPIFSTNNYRQTIGALAEYAADHDKKHLDKARFFGGTLLVFHIGAAAAFFICSAFGARGAFFGLIPTALLTLAVIAPKAALHAHPKAAHN